MLQYALIPCEPHSTPIPLSFTPPKGVFGERSKWLLTLTVPASSLRAIRVVSAVLEDQTEAPKPILVLFARPTTSSSVFHDRIGTIGPVQVSWIKRVQWLYLPNGSSSTILDSSGGLSMMVGVMKYPSDGSISPPIAIFNS